MFKDYDYANKILHSWPIPVFLMIAAATHWIVETLAAGDYARGPFILISFLLAPLMVSMIFRKRRILLGAAINGVYISFSFSVYALQHALIKNDFMTFPVVLAFGLACGACAGGFYDRLSRGFSKAA